MSETGLDEPEVQILELYAEMKKKWEGISMEERQRLPKLRRTKNTKLTIQAINRTLKATMSTSFNLDNIFHKVYTAATVAYIILQTWTREQHTENQSSHKHPWEERIVRKITALKKEIGTLHAYLKSQRPSKKLEDSPKKSNWRKKIINTIRITEHIPKI